ncbi:hypothetical protein BH11GEM1_BH11GEM1_17530 [soil metagenome]
MRKGGGGTAILRVRPLGVYRRRVLAFLLVTAGREKGLHHATHTRHSASRVLATSQGRIWRRHGNTFG